MEQVNPLRDRVDEATRRLRFRMRRAWTSGSIQTMVRRSDGWGAAWTVVQVNATSRRKRTRQVFYFLSERNTTFRIR